MTDLPAFSRRAAIKSSIFGLLTVSMPHIVFARDPASIPVRWTKPDGLFHRYPAIDDAIVAEVVGASHFNLDRVREMVNHRPELARATWDWGFGDWETALGAASHVGRRDIAGFLMDHGARPDIFTYAMLGSYQPVKSMIEAIPGIQTIAGPHGISLLQHAKNGSRSEGLPDEQREEYDRLISYLEKLGNADLQPEFPEMTAGQKEKYLGDYKYGEGPEDGFTIKLNMRKQLALGRLGASGGALYQKAENVFSYNGTTSVEIRFQVENERVISLTVDEPDLILTARKV
jgi:hypothetical protein